MPKSHRPYAPEFRRQMVDLVRSGRTPEALSREFEPTAQVHIAGRGQNGDLQLRRGVVQSRRRHSGIRYLSPIAYETQMLEETQTT